MEFKNENSPVFTTLTIQMSNGEQFRAEAGAMLSMSPTITLEAKKSGKGRRKQGRKKRRMRAKIRHRKK